MCNYGFALFLIFGLCLLPEESTAIEKLEKFCKRSHGFANV